MAFPSARDSAVTFVIQFAARLISHSFGEPAYGAAPGINPEFAQFHYRYSYESFVTPRSIFDFEVSARKSILRKQQAVLGGYDSSLYASERIHALASDSTRIPISIVYRKDTLRDGNAPLLLYGYGSYGISIPINFSSNRLSLLDRGVIFAVAHIRGGGELGKPCMTPDACATSSTPSPTSSPAPNI